MVNNENQTTNSQSVNKSNQTSEKVSIGVQVDAEKFNYLKTSYDSNKLAKFLNEIWPYLKWALSDSFSYGRNIVYDKPKPVTEFTNTLEFKKIKFIGFQDASVSNQNNKVRIPLLYLIKSFCI